MSNPLDLYAIRFWLFTGIAVVLLNALVGTARKWAFAILNLVFLGTYLGRGRLMAALLVGLLLFWLSLRLMRIGRARATILLLAGSGALTLFVFHKRPDLFVVRFPVLEHLETLLITIGFSYVVLRFYELMRAVSEGRHEPPDWPSLVNYLLPFHMLAAGPIQAYDEFVTQPAPPPPLTLRDGRGASTGSPRGCSRSTCSPT